jgi:hypothetical protein
VRGTELRCELGTWEKRVKGSKSKRKQSFFSPFCFCPLFRVAFLYFLPYPYLTFLLYSEGEFATVPASSRYPDRTRRESELVRE